MTGEALGSAGEGAWNMHSGACARVSTAPDNTLIPCSSFRALQKQGCDIFILWH